MSDQDNPSGNHEYSDQGNANAQPDNVPNGIERQANNEAPNNSQQQSGARPKRSVPVRVWHALWRKRIFWHPKSDRPHVNWAEITTVCLTIGIVIAAFIQAFIYWKQAGIMERSLEQNQQTIALNTGQVAIAGRNAKTAGDTLIEIKNGGVDTHNLAVAAKDQAAAAKLQVGEMKKQETQTHELAVQAGKQAEAAKLQADNTKEALKHSDDAFRISEQPYMTIGDADGLIAKFIPPSTQSDWTGLALYLRNSGRLPANPVCVSTDVSPDPSIAPQTFQWHPMYRITGTNPPQSFNVAGNGGCKAVGGDSIYRYVISRALPPGVLEKVKAASPSNPLGLNVIVEYCSPFGQYSCKVIFTQYDPPPIDTFSDLGETECTYLYGRIHPLPALAPNSKFLTACEQPGETEKRAKEEAEYWRTHPAPQPQTKPK